MKLHSLLSTVALSTVILFSSCGNCKKSNCSKEKCQAQCEQTCEKTCHKTCPNQPSCADTCTLSCCKATVEKIDIATLLNKEYAVTSIEGNVLEVSAEETPTMNFNWEEQQVAGSTGCNNHIAKFNATPCGKITFTEAGVTRMMCSDMQIEDAFLAAFAKVTRMATTTEGINLTDDKGNTLVSLQAK